MTRTKSIYLASVAVMLSPAAAYADIIWDWSFSNTSGQFVTDGTDPLAGVFTLLDFSVTASDLGATIGSVSGGEYAQQGLITDPLYTMAWDGSAVTDWFHSGANDFDWWVFDDLLASTSAWILFGWEAGNINTVDQATYFQSPCCDSPSFSLSVAPSTSVPEPGTLGLLGIGLFGMALFRRKNE